jgi:hypothetical protein
VGSKPTSAKIEAGFAGERVQEVGRLSKMAEWKARQSAGRRNAATAVKQQLRKAGGVDQVVL